MIFFKFVIFTPIIAYEAKHHQKSSQTLMMLAVPYSFLWIAHTQLNKEAKICSLLNDVIHESPLAVNILEIKVLK